MGSIKSPVIKNNLAIKRRKRHDDLFDSVKHLENVKMGKLQKRVSKLIIQSQMSTIVEESYNPHRQIRKIHNANQSVIKNALKGIATFSSSGSETASNRSASANTSDPSATSHDVDSLTLCSSRNLCYTHSYNLVKEKSNMSNSSIDLTEMEYQKRRRKTSSSRPARRLEENTKRSYSNSDIYSPNNFMIYPIHVDIPKFSILSKNNNNNNNNNNTNNNNNNNNKGRRDLESKISVISLKKKPHNKKYNNKSKTDSSEERVRQPSIISCILSEMLSDGKQMKSSTKTDHVDVDVKSKRTNSFSNQKGNVKDARSYSSKHSKDKQENLEKSRVKLDSKSKSDTPRRKEKECKEEHRRSGLLKTKKEKERDKGNNEKDSKTKSKDRDNKNIKDKDRKVRSKSRIPEAIKKYAKNNKKHKDEHKAKPMPDRNAKSSIFKFRKSFLHLSSHKTKPSLENILKSNDKLKMNKTLVSLKVSDDNEVSNYNVVTTRSSQMQRFFEDNGTSANDTSTCNINPKERTIVTRAELGSLDIPAFSDLKHPQSSKETIGIIKPIEPKVSKTNEFGSKPQIIVEVPKVSPPKEDIIDSTSTVRVPVLDTILRTSNLVSELQHDDQTTLHSAALLSEVATNSIPTVIIEQSASEPPEMDAENKVLPTKLPSKSKVSEQQSAVNTFKNMIENIYIKPLLEQYPSILGESSSFGSLTKLFKRRAKNKGTNTDIVWTQDELRLNRFCYRTICKAKSKIPQNSKKIGVKANLFNKKQLRMFNTYRNIAKDYKNIMKNSKIPVWNSKMREGSASSTRTSSRKSGRSPSRIPRPKTSDKSSSNLARNETNKEGIEELVKMMQPSGDVQNIDDESLSMEMLYSDDVDVQKITDCNSSSKKQMKKKDKRAWFSNFFIRDNKTNSSIQGHRIIEKVTTQEECLLGSENPTVFYINSQMDHTNTTGQASTASVASSSNQSQKDGPSVSLQILVPTLRMSPTTSTDIFRSKRSLNTNKKSRLPVPVQNAASRPRTPANSVVDQKYVFPIEVDLMRQQDTGSMNVRRHRHGRQTNQAGNNAGDSRQNRRRSDDRLNRGDIPMPQTPDSLILHRRATHPTTFRGRLHTLLSKLCGCCVKTASESCTDVANADTTSTTLSVQLRISNHMDVFDYPSQNIILPSAHPGNELIYQQLLEKPPISRYGFVNDVVVHTVHSISLLASTTAMANAASSLDSLHIINTPITHSRGLTFYAYKSYLRQYLLDKEVLRMLTPCVKGKMLKAAKRHSDSLLLAEPQPALTHVPSQECKPLHVARRFQKRSIDHNKHTIDEAIEENVAQNADEEKEKEEEEYVEEIKTPSDCIIKLATLSPYMYEIDVFDEEMICTPTSSIQSCMDECIFSTKVLPEVVGDIPPEAASTISPLCEECDDCDTFIGDDFTIMLQIRRSYEAIIISFYDMDIYVMCMESDGKIPWTHKLYAELYTILKGNWSFVHRIHHNLQQAANNINDKEALEKARDFIGDILASVILCEGRVFKLDARAVKLIYDKHVLSQRAVCGGAKKLNPECRLVTNLIHCHGDFANVKAARKLEQYCKLDYFMPMHQTHYVYRVDEDISAEEEEYIYHAPILWVLAQRLRRRYSKRSRKNIAPHCPPCKSVCVHTEESESKEIVAQRSSTQRGHDLVEKKRMNPSKYSMPSSAASLIRSNATLTTIATRDKNDSKNEDFTDNASNVANYIATPLENWESNTSIGEEKSKKNKSQSKNNWREEDLKENDSLVGKYVATSIENWPSNTTIDKEKAKRNKSHSSKSNWQDKDEENSKPNKSSSKNNWQDKDEENPKPNKSHSKCNWQDKDEENSKPNKSPSKNNWQDKDEEKLQTNKSRSKKNRQDKDEGKLKTNKSQSKTNWQDDDEEKSPSNKSQICNNEQVTTVQHVEVTCDMLRGAPSNSTGSLSMFFKTAMPEIIVIMKKETSSVCNDLLRNQASSMNDFIIKQDVAVEPFLISTRDENVYASISRNDTVSRGTTHSVPSLKSNTTNTNLFTSSFSNLSSFDANFSQHTSQSVPNIDSSYSEPMTTYTTELIKKQSTFTRLVNLFKAKHKTKKCGTPKCAMIENRPISNYTINAINKVIVEDATHASAAAAKAKRFDAEATLTEVPKNSACVSKWEGFEEPKFTEAQLAAALKRANYSEKTRTTASMLVFVPDSNESADSIAEQLVRKAELEPTIEIPEELKKSLLESKEVRRNSSKKSVGISMEHAYVITSGTNIPQDNASAHRCNCRVQKPKLTFIPSEALRALLSKRRSVGNDPVYRLVTPKELTSAATSTSASLHYVPSHRRVTPSVDIYRRSWPPRISMTSVSIQVQPSIREVNQSTTSFLIWLKNNGEVAISQRNSKEHPSNRHSKISINQEAGQATGTEGTINKSPHDNNGDEQCVVTKCKQKCLKMEGDEYRPYIEPNSASLAKFNNAAVAKQTQIKTFNIRDSDGTLLNKAAVITEKQVVGHKDAIIDVPQAFSDTSILSNLKRTLSISNIEIEQLAEVTTVSKVTTLNNGADSQQMPTRPSILKQYENNDDGRKKPNVAISAEPPVNVAISATKRIEIALDKDQPLPSALNDKTISEMILEQKIIKKSTTDGDDKADMITVHRVSSLMGDDSRAVSLIVEAPDKSKRGELGEIGDQPTKSIHSMAANPPSSDRESLSNPEKSENFEALFDLNGKPSQSREAVVKVESKTEDVTGTESNATTISSSFAKSTDASKISNSQQTSPVRFSGVEQGVQASQSSIRKYMKDENSESNKENVGKSCRKDGRCKRFGAVVVHRPVPICDGATSPHAKPTARSTATIIIEVKNASTNCRSKNEDVARTIIEISNLNDNRLTADGPQNKCMALKEGDVRQSGESTSSDKSSEKKGKGIKRKKRDTSDPLSNDIVPLETNKMKRKKVQETILEVSDKDVTSNKRSCRICLRKRKKVQQSNFEELNELSDVLKNTQALEEVMQETVAKCEKNECLKCCLQKMARDIKTNKSNISKLLNNNPPDENVATLETEPLSTDNVEVDIDSKSSQKTLEELDSEAHLNAKSKSRIKMEEEMPNKKQEKEAILIQKTVKQQKIHISNGKGKSTTQFAEKVSIAAVPLTLNKHVTPDSSQLSGGGAHLKQTPYPSKALVTESDEFAEEEYELESSVTQPDVTTSVSSYTVCDELCKKASPNTNEPRQKLNDVKDSSPRATLKADATDTESYSEKRCCHKSKRKQQLPERVLVAEAVPLQEEPATATATVKPFVDLKKSHISLIDSLQADMNSANVHKAEIPVRDELISVISLCSTHTVLLASAMPPATMTVEEKTSKTSNDDDSMEEGAVIDDGTDNTNSNKPDKWVDSRCRCCCFQIERSAQELTTATPRMSSASKPSSKNSARESLTKSGPPIIPSRLTKSEVKHILSQVFSESTMRDLTAVTHVSKTHMPSRQVSNLYRERKSSYSDTFSCAAHSSSDDCTTCAIPPQTETTVNYNVNTKTSPIKSDAATESLASLQTSSVTDSQTTFTVKATSEDELPTENSRVSVTFKNDGAKSITSNSSQQLSASEKDNNEMKTMKPEVNGHSNRSSRDERRNSRSHRSSRDRQPEILSDVTEGKQQALKDTAVGSSHVLTAALSDDEKVRKLANCHESDNENVEKDSCKPENNAKRVRRCKYQRNPENAVEMSTSVSRNNAHHSFDAKSKQKCLSISLSADLNPAYSNKETQVTQTPRKSKRESVQSNVSFEDVKSSATENTSNDQFEEKTEQMQPQETMGENIAKEVEDDGVTIKKFNKMMRTGIKGKLDVPPCMMEDKNTKPQRQDIYGSNNNNNNNAMINNNNNINSKNPLNLKPCKCFAPTTTENRQQAPPMCSCAQKQVHSSYPVAVSGHKFKFPPDESTIHGKTGKLSDFKAKYLSRMPHSKTKKAIPLRSSNARPAFIKHGHSVTTMVMQDNRRPCNNDDCRDVLTLPYESRSDHEWSSTSEHNLLNVHSKNIIVSYQPPPPTSDFIANDLSNRRYPSLTHSPPTPASLKHPAKASEPRKPKQHKEKSHLTNVSSKKIRKRDDKAKNQKVNFIAASIVELKDKDNEASDKQKSGGTSMWQRQVEWMKSKFAKKAPPPKPLVPVPVPTKLDACKNKATACTNAPQQINIALLNWHDNNPLISKEWTSGAMLRQTTSSGIVVEIDDRVLILNKCFKSPSNPLKSSYDRLSTIPEHTEELNNCELEPKHCAKKIDKGRCLESSSGEQNEHLHSNCTKYSTMVSNNPYSDMTYKSNMSYPSRSETVRTNSAIYVMPNLSKNDPSQEEEEEDDKKKEHKTLGERFINFFQRAIKSNSSNNGEKPKLFGKSRVSKNNKTFKRVKEIRIGNKNFIIQSCRMAAAEMKRNSQPTIDSDIPSLRSYETLGETWRNYVEVRREENTAFNLDAVETVKDLIEQHQNRKRIYDLCCAPNVNQRPIEQQVSQTRENLRRKCDELHKKLEELKRQREVAQAQNAEIECLENFRAQMKKERKISEGTKVLEQIKAMTPDYLSNPFHNIPTKDIQKGRRLVGFDNDVSVMSKLVRSKSVSSIKESVHCDDLNKSKSCLSIHEMHGNIDSFAKHNTICSSFQLEKLSNTSYKRDEREYILTIHNYNHVHENKRRVAISKSKHLDRKVIMYMKRQKPLIKKPILIKRAHPHHTYSDDDSSALQPSHHHRTAVINLDENLTPTCNASRQGRLDVESYSDYTTIVRSGSGGNDCVTESISKTGQTSCSQANIKYYLVPNSK